jgi:hypothetical protein
MTEGNRCAVAPIDGLYYARNTVTEFQYEYVYSACTVPPDLERQSDTVCGTEWRDSAFFSSPQPVFRISLENCLEYITVTGPTRYCILNLMGTEQRRGRDI